MKNILTRFAAELQNGGGNIDIPTLTAGEVLQNALNIVFFILGAVAVVTIIVGGIMYATSAGEPGNMTKAKNLILYAVIGVVIVIAAYAITNFVWGRFS